MRRFAGFAVVIAAFVAAGATGAGAGHIVRVQAPERREVIVPAGQFVMGIEEDEVAELDQECRLAFELHEPTQFPLPNGTHTSFCEMYTRELEEMVDKIQLDDATTVERRVYLSAFAIDRDEVTVADYRKCIATGACELDPLIAGDERYIVDAWPLVNVTWDEAQTYCRWRGGRLPTEAEWEHAARGDDDRRWPWGSTDRPADFNHGMARVPAMRELDRLAWAGIPLQFLGDTDASDGTALIAPPGTYPWGEGPYGTRDQAGNVAEWTADALGGATSTAMMTNDLALGYRDLPSINPMREGRPGDPRVVRGGSWRQPAFLARANVRDPYNALYVPDGRFTHIGFRCARSL
jgi:formylglycine-generating enzyme required for sulfatase activity